MPSGEPQAAKLARSVRKVYDDAGAELLSLVASEVDATVTDEAGTTAIEAALAASRVAAGAARIAARLDRLGIDTAAEALTTAQTEGLRQADRELRALLGRAANDYRRSGNLAALAAYSRGLADHLRDANRAILRQAPDAYRDIVGEVLTPKIAGAEAQRRKIAQRALGRFADRGIVDFVDRDGKRWELATYVEMATRTAAARTMVEAQIDRLGTQGIDLVIVSDSPRECAICRPWEGKVLHARAGHPGTVSRKSVLGPQLVDVEVAGSVPFAMAAGLLHPNCTHALAGYMPGATRPPTDTEDPEGYDVRQKLRYLERGVRKWKRRELAAIDPAAKREAKAKTKTWQAAIKAHVTETGIIRQPPRERVGVAR